MKGLAFQLSGKTAMFKKPEVNSSVYLTYNNIHKVALLGILGAVIGLDGHEQHHRYNLQNKEKIPFPEFYEVLKDLQVGIIPRAEKGYFTKKLQVFNNSVGYASKEEGGNLIVKEYWLENPKWDIYLYTDNANIMSRLEESLLNNKTAYTPYLGKNDHLADIKNCRKVEIQPIQWAEGIHSLVNMEDVDFNIDASDAHGEDLDPYMFKESIPVGLLDEYCLYRMKTFLYTNMEVKKVKKHDVLYEVEEQVIYMF